MLRRFHTIKVPVKPTKTTAATRVPAATAPYLLDDAMLAPFVVVASFSYSTALHRQSKGQALQCLLSVQTEVAVTCRVLSCLQASSQIGVWDFVMGYFQIEIAHSMQPTQQLRA